MSFDIAINPLTGDIYDGSIVVRGAERVIQKIKMRLQRGLGEWILDTNAGIDYVGFFESKASPQAIDALQQAMRFEVSQVKGLLSLEEFNLSYSPTTQTLSISCSGVVQDTRTTATRFTLNDVPLQLGLGTPRATPQVT